MDKIAQSYELYSDIISEFTEERIQERFQDFYDAYDDFIEKMHLKKVIRINSYTLWHAVLDYFTDISRLKKFHKIKRINTFKIMAYELSWLIRRKPLQIIVDEDAHKDRAKAEALVFINEKFVLSYIVSYFTELIGYDFYETLNEHNKACFDGYLDSLFYYLKYRNCSSQALEFALLSFGAGIAATNVKIAFSEEREC
jgi:hypothetical protein